MTPPALTAHEWRSFVLCADDFAMTPGVSKAILALLAAQRITATCCDAESAALARTVGEAPGTQRDGRHRRSPDIDLRPATRCHGQRCA